MLTPTTTDSSATGRLSRRAAILLIAAMILLIVAGDLVLARRYNLGALYMIPFILATQYIHRSARLLLLTMTLIGLNYLALASAYFPHFKTDELLRFRLLNRGFVSIALAGAAFLIVFYLRARDYWLRRQARMAPTDQEVALLVQVFQMFEDIIAVMLATFLAAATFAVDYFTPRGMNLPILYLMPLAIVAITRSRLLLWITVPILLAFAYIGFLYGPADNFSDDVAQRIAVNRQLSVGSIVVAAALFHLATSPKKQRRPADAPSGAA